MRRIESLDYLRGVMSVSIMLYHYSSWSLGTLGGETLLGKLGIYAVSIFYVLSGLSLAIVYGGRIQTFSDVGAFLIRRLFRILPLFWLAVTVSIAYRYLVSTVGNDVFDISGYTVFLNYSLLFVIFEPTAYLVTGAWSIGNEMVFYLILPFVFLLHSRSKVVLPLVILLSLVVSVGFSFKLIDANKPLSTQWSTYIDPLNHLFLFMAGVGIGKWGGRRKNFPTRLGWVILGGALLLFLFWPANGDKVQIVSGMERWVFSTLSILLVLMLFLLDPVLESWPHRVLSFLGQGCYSIYLLHPLVSMPFAFVGAKVGLGSSYVYVLSSFATLACSWLTFKYIEKPTIAYGKRLGRMVTARTVPAEQHESKA